MRNPRFPLILTLFLLLLLILTGCRGQGSTPFPSQTATATEAVVDQAGSDLSAGFVPKTLIVKTELRPAIDPACMQERGGFALVSAPLPEEGLEPGMVHLFCAVGAPAGALLNFTLASPQGDVQTFQVPSVDQGGVNVAVQPVTIGADAAPGTWTLTASYEDLSDSITFQVRPATQPFVTLAEPVSENPSRIKAAVGGVAPNGQVHFAVYRLQPSGIEDGAAVARGELLIENLIQVDEKGRADVHLDVADQPSGPYLLAIFPPDQPAQATATLHLPAQERTAVAVNIYREALADQETSPPAAAPLQPAPQPVGLRPDDLPADPVLAEGSGGLPEKVTFALKSASLPACLPTTSPAITLWPETGEVGQWWYGCASGFAANAPLQADASLGNGATTSYDLTATDAQGVKPFRWYALPAEGAGDFTLALSDAAGHQAQTSWRIGAAQSPHVLVYPHVALKDVGAQLVLAGFSARQQVQMGVYRLEGDVGTRVMTFQVKVDKRGQLQQDFTQVQDLKPGVYALLAQSAPTYHFEGIDAPATAVEFFSVGARLPEKYELYTLSVGRVASMKAALGESASPSEPTSPPEPSPTSTSGLPATLAIPQDNSAAPTCPDASAGEPAICLSPPVIERATYAYMLMHGFKPYAKFIITVTTPAGKKVKLQVQANQDGLADAHWYALNNEKLGLYRVRIRGGGKKFVGSFKVVKATRPHVVVQPRSPIPGTPVIISISGLQPQKTYVLARYRRVDEGDGQVRFAFMDKMALTTGRGGGAQATFPTREEDAGALFLAALYEQGGSQPLAKEVYAPGQELYLRYPFAWGENP